MVDIIRMITNDIELQRFLVKIEFPDDVENECWLWKKSNSGGYGFFYIGKETYMAHRVSYDHFWGPIPEGMVLDHLCRNRRCVNPRHLEPVMHAENGRRNRILPALDENGIEIPKLCCRCHERPRHPKRNKYCAECHNAISRVWKAAHPMTEEQRISRTEYLREYRKTHPEKVRAAEQTVTRLAKHREYQRNHSEENYARKIVEGAIGKGIIKRPKRCEVCGNACIPDAHIADFSEPFVITWICRSCNMRAAVARKKHKLKDQP
jgi:hypothetical protein